jgi:hypothetical protein
MINIQTQADHARLGAARTAVLTFMTVDKPMKKSQIIAMGGGGFSMEPDNPLLDEYFLARTGRRKPRICILPTASGDAQSYIARFYAAFRKLQCRSVPVF